MVEVPTLHGDDVFLNAYAPADAVAHVAGEDEETARRFGWWPRRSTQETVLASYWEWAKNWRENGPIRTFAARDSVTGELVGGCELRIKPDNSGEVAYWTHADRRGMGYAGQALSLLCDYAASIGVRLLEAHVALDNHASRRVAETAGFIASGVLVEEGEERIRYIRN